MQFAPNVKEASTTLKNFNLQKKRINRTATRWFFTASHVQNRDMISIRGITDRVKAQDLTIPFRKRVDDMAVLKGTIVSPVRFNTFLYQLPKGTRTFLISPVVSSHRLVTEW